MQVYSIGSSSSAGTGSVYFYNTPNATDICWYISSVDIANNQCSEGESRGRTLADMGEETSGY